MTQAAYNCAPCNMSFPSEDALRQHNEQAHNQFVCRACGEVFESQEARRAHGQTAHPR